MIQYFFIDKMPGKQTKENIKIEATEAMVPSSKRQHSSDEVAELKPGSQPDRTFMGDFEASNQWKEV